MIKEEALKKAKRNKCFLQKTPVWNNDKEVVLTAVKQNGTSLKFASGELKNDKDVIFVAVQQDGDALQFASDELRNDKEVVMTTVQRNGGLLYWASDKLKNDKKVVLAAVCNNGYALYYASDELKNDKEVVLAAVQQNGHAFQYASNNLRQDKEIILIAIKQGPLVCRHSLLKGYRNFDEIVEKEGDEFLFSCWNNDDYKIRLRVANHHNFLPTLEQVEMGLKDENDEVQEIYRLRQDEWFAKIEENKLKPIFY